MASAPRKSWHFQSLAEKSELSLFNKCGLVFLRPWVWRGHWTLTCVYDVLGTWDWRTWVLEDPRKRAAWRVSPLPEGVMAKSHTSLEMRNVW